MSIRELGRMEIPDGTTVEEHDLVTDGDVFVGGQSTVEFGVRGRTVVGGERVRFGGDIEAAEDCRLDMWCDVAGNVLVGENAYIGERVHVGGQLIVSGDLDIGDDVDVEEGFEANGWIVIRNPMPTIVFLVVYLTHLLRLGEDEEAERVMDEVLGDEGGPEPVLIPRGSRVSDDAWRVSTPASIGDECRLHGNVRAETIEMGRDTELFGSLRAKGDISVGLGTVIHGDVTTRDGQVTLDAGVRVRGDVSCDDLDLHDDAEVDGTIRANGEVTIRREPVETPDLGEVEAEALADDGRDTPTPAVVAIDADSWLAEHSRLVGDADESETGDGKELPPVEEVDRPDPVLGRESGGD